ncbi:signal peptidase I [Blastococcus sp. CT_GayMR19]|uniref:signal peptidase I n=1 Tax=Blastococcus sp. CT_GayMR19 TaxID=2559608 RepID=UPI0010733D70|nr:signal peptidase I [Blastococcus sp. CT_GayMR19]TFV78264.1 signal peptidase I [Blastococcus sp. CT_GayMR19]
MTSLLQVVRPGAAQLPPGSDLLLAARRWAGPTRRFLARALPWVVRGIVVVAVVAFAGLAVGPHVLGYRTMTMLTASMSPAIDPGDVTIVTPLAVTDVTEGMVITYHIPIGEHQLVTHRVMSVEQGTDGSVTVQTKGDANESIDPWKATLAGDTAYEVRAVVPEIGHVIHALRTPAVATALVYGAPALVAGWLLLSIWRPRKQEEEVRA